jgi:hypothetical protein
MGRKKKVLELVLPEGWVVSNKIQINGRNVSRGTEISIQGESGRFRFLKHVKSGSREWVDVIGGKRGYEAFRSFDISRVKRVHSKNRTRHNLAS